jgi:hypothetical protein
LKPPLPRLPLLPRPSLPRRLPAEAAAAPAPVPNKGDNAWLIVATALVIMMSVPGLALFYGGLVRAKNMLSVLLQVFSVFSLISVLWVVYGYSIAFTEGSAFFGGLDKVLLKGITPDSVAATFSKGVVISEFIYVAFQGAFAAITVALILRRLRRAHQVLRGAAVSVLWFTFSYLPMAHMVWYWAGPDAYTSAEAADAANATAGYLFQKGRPRLRRRYRGAHQRRRRRPGRCLHGRQADRLRQGVLCSAQPDPDHRRRLPAVGGLVRFQRRFGPRSQRHGRPRLRQYLAGHRDLCGDSPGWWRNG